MNQAAVRKAGYTLAAAGAGVTLAFVAYAASRAVRSEDAGILLVALWSAVPYGLYGFVLTRSGNSPRATLATAVVAALAGLAAVFFYLDATVLRPTPESALTFVYFPVLQVLACLAIPLIALILPRQKPTSGGPP